MSLRVLADRAMVEFFLGDGRGAITTGVQYWIGIGPGEGCDKTKVFITAAAETGVEVASAAAWAMGCGWAHP
jgi:hypothetical protein